MPPHLENQGIDPIAEPKRQAARLVAHAQQQRAAIAQAGIYARQHIFLRGVGNVMQHIQNRDYIAGRELGTGNVSLLDQRPILMRGQRRARAFHIPGH